MESNKVEEKKKIGLIDAHLESAINGVNENYAIAQDINGFFFSDRPKPLSGEAAKGEAEETPVGWLDAVIEKLKFINATNTSICSELRRLHKETT